MALPGPAPDPNKIGRTPNADWTEIPDVPFEAGRLRELPTRIVPDTDADGAVLFTEGGWAAQTEAWWDIVRTMPHASLWSATDWLFATDTALLKDAFYTGTANSSDKVEMRRREDLLAMSSEARRKARIRYVAPAATETPLGDGDNVTPISKGRASRRIVED